MQSKLKFDYLHLSTAALLNPDPVYQKRLSDYSRYTLQLFVCLNAVGQQAKQTSTINEVKNIENCTCILYTYIVTSPQSCNIFLKQKKKKTFSLFYVLWYLGIEEV